MAPEHPGPALFRTRADNATLQASLERLIRAFAIDGNAEHIISAYRELRDAGMHPSDEFLSHLDIALRRVRPITQRGHRPPSVALRKVAMLDALAEITGSRDVPAILPAGVGRKIAERLRVPRYIVQMAFSRMRLARWAGARKAEGRR